ncbi:MAG: carbamoyl phosphate synthase small subunit [Gammaproteobacteria bacterium RIFCSPHIGHO2_12_FULL_42_13]|nr:MAG: carbamoyl phosphate synthase small subunit [Gammaproteobacteria bacterium RIFCSPHIGHO2_12_FULL_42_13]
MSIEDQGTRCAPAILALADGAIFQGFSIGYPGETVGEVVFNTAMTGYQEVLTDPSYSEQIVTFTYPHIGNTGINPDDWESDRVHAAGMIIRELSPFVSHWQATESLSDYLKRQKVVAIAGIDTRRLTHILRQKGAQAGCIMAGAESARKQNDAHAKASQWIGLSNKDLAIKVTRSTSSRGAGRGIQIVLYDFGVKQNIIRVLEKLDYSITIVPAKTSVEAVLKLNPAGIVLSNGPGDPAACSYAIENAKILIQKKVPIFGICLGFQILALALGAKTKKMKFGHHGTNHPVKECATARVLITSQNHGFCVDEKTLPKDVEITHVSLFDGTLQGFKHTTLPVMAFQGHPEAGPGPNDAMGLFDEFTKMVMSNGSA